MENQIQFTSFAEFVTSPAGRAVKVMLGLALLAKGLKANSFLGHSLALLGAIPLAAGIFDFDPWMRFMGGSSKGSDNRFTLHMQSGYPQLGSESQTWFKS